MAAALLMPALYGVYLQASRLLIKLQWQERLEQERQVTLMLPNDQIRWQEEDREIIVDGQLFDISRIKPGKDSTQFTGIYDEAESAIEKSIEHYFNQQEAEDDVRLYTAFMHFIFPESCPIRYNLDVATITSACSFSVIASKPTKGIQPVPTPPPDCSC